MAMSRRTPLPWALPLALALLSSPSAHGAAPPQTQELSSQELASARQRLHVALIKSRSAELVASPVMDVERDRPVHEKVQALGADLAGLFSVKDPRVARGVFGNDRPLLDAIGAVYADARYVNYLPPIPAEFQRILGVAQVDQAIAQTRTEEAQYTGKDLTPKQQKALAALQKREQALAALARKIQAASTEGDLQASLGTLAHYFESASPAGPGQAGPDGTRGRYGLKPAPPATAKTPALPALPALAAAKALPVSQGSNFLPSLKLAVDALKSSFPLPVNVSALAQSAAGASVRHEATRAWAALDGMDSNCRARSKQVSAADCARVGELLAQYGSISAALRDSRSRGDAAGYYQAELLEGRWQSDADAFLRDYFQRWASGQYEQHSDFERMAAGFSKTQMAGFCAGLASPAAVGLTAAPVAQWIGKNYPGISKTDLALKAAKMQVEGGLYCAGKVMKPVGVVLSPITNTASSAYYHAAGALSVNIGNGKKTLATIYRGYGLLAKEFGMDKTAKWLQGQSNSWAAGGADDVSYGVATMMQSKWTMMPREWYLQAGGPTVDDPTGQKGARQVEDDLKMFAVNSLREKWGDALPAAAYLGLVNRDPTRAEVVDAVKNGAGGLNGAMKMALDDAARSWDTGGWGGKFKAGGLWTMVTAVKAGDMAAQSLAFAGVGGLLGTAASEAGAASNITKVANIYKVTAEVGKYPFYVGLVEGGEQTIKAAAAGDTRAVMEGTSELASAGLNLGLGVFAKEPVRAKTVEPKYADDVLVAAGAKPDEQFLRDRSILEGPKELVPAEARAGAAVRAPARAPVAAEGIKTIDGSRRDAFKVNGAEVRKVGAGGSKDVLVHPDDPSLVVKVFLNSSVDPAMSASEMRFERTRAALLEKAGAGPRTVSSGLAQGDGGVRGYMIQERVINGADLETMTPIKLAQLKDLFGRLTEARLKVDVDTGNFAQNILVGETPSPPGLRAWVVDAAPVEQVPGRTLGERFSGKDPLRDYYDGLYKRFAKQMWSQSPPDSPAAQIALAALDGKVTRAGASQERGPARAGGSEPEKTDRAQAPTREDNVEVLKFAESRLNDEELAEWRRVKQNVVSELAADGYKPEKIVTELDDLAGSFHQMVMMAAHDPEGYSGRMADALRARLASETAREALVDKGYDPKRVENWVRRSYNGMATLNAEQAAGEAQRQFDAIDRVVAEAKRLRKQGDNDGVLRLAQGIEQTDPAIADYLKPWKNDAFGKVYRAAMVGKNSAYGDNLVERLNADADGRVDAYYRTANVLKQKGPSCGIHALYNIVGSYLHGTGEPLPDYASFERAVQKELGPQWGGKVIGKDIGMTPGDLMKAARAAGLDSRQIELLPKSQEQFDALLASREGAAWLSIAFRESHGLGKTESANHAVFVGEKWVDSKGQTWYTVADSNGGPNDVAYYTWDQLGPRLKAIVLLKPAEPGMLAQRVGTFAYGARPPPPKYALSAKLPGPDSPSQAQRAYWGLAAEDPYFAAEVYRANRGIFSSVQEVRDYAKGRLKVIDGNLVNYEVPQRVLEPKRTFEASPKHEEGAWGTPNPFDAEASQALLDGAIPSAKKANSQALYNIQDGRVIVFRITNGATYHGYELPPADFPSRLPSDVLKAFRAMGKINDAEYKKLLKGQPIR